MTLLIVCSMMAMLSCKTASTQSELKKEVVIDSYCAWDGKPLPVYPQEAPRITLLRITIPPHAKLDWHKHPIINVGYMTKGSLTVTSDDGSTKTINSRDGIIELVDQYHYGENKSNKETEIIVFYVGTKESQLSEGRSSGVLLPKTQ
ncbi:MAG: cupin domain-containing protein [Bacteroidaceae bacterium]